MRVIGGEVGGRRLRVPSVPGLRPTGDRARETLFNVVGADVAGSRVLDVFAGTGALGIEALSRGAIHATFVERHRVARRAIQRNLAACGYEEQSRVLGGDWQRALARLGSEGSTFRFAFFDPPYDRRRPEEILDVAGRWRILDAGGLLVLERRTGVEVALPRGWRRTRVLKVGDTSFDLFAAARDGDG